MKTSEFENELKKLGYVFDGKCVNTTDCDNQYCWAALISPVVQGKIKWDWRLTIDGKFNLDLFKLINRYSATPIEEREDKPKEELFNIQMIKGNWSELRWLFRTADCELDTATETSNYEDDQQWTVDQIKEYGIDDEAVYKRVPVEDENE